MNPQIEVKENLLKLDGIKKAVTKLTDKAVYIGVPAETANDGSPHAINNAELSYIHEYGAPARNIPARPHLVPGVERILPEAAKELEDAAKLALDGDAGAVDAAFERIGLAGQSSVRQMFADNDWPALNEKTLNYKPLLKDQNGKPMLDKKGDKMRKPSRKEQGKINPLFVTGALQKSHTYVIRERKNDA